jgi:hypothetical protein
MADGNGSVDGWWSAGEALGWIAFGQPVPGANWWDIPGLGLSRNWIPSRRLLSALEAKAESKLLHAAGISSSPPGDYGTVADELIQRTRQSAAVLAEELRGDMARDAECLAEVERAQAVLRVALAGHHLVAYGQLAQATDLEPASDEFEAIPAEVFAGPSALTVQPDGRTTPPRMSRPYRGRLWQEVSFAAAAVQAAFPLKDDRLARGLSEAAISRTGAAGRPSSMYLIHPEHERRMAAGEAYVSLAAEAEYLAGWFRKTHPSKPTPKPRTIENQIRDAHRQHRGAPTK